MSKLQDKLIRALVEQSGDCGAVTNEVARLKDQLAHADKAIMTLNAKVAQLQIDCKKRGEATDSFGKVNAEMEKALNKLADAAAVAMKRLKVNSPARKALSSAIYDANNYVIPF